MSPPPSTWRRALPLVRVGEGSDLPAAALAALLAAGGERVAALEAYREILDASPDDMTALVAFAALLARMGRDEEELAIRTRIAILEIERMGIAEEHRSAAVAFELATLGIGAAPAEMPPGYAAALFDGHAARFDAHLRDTLRYRAPELLHAALARALAGTRPLAALDVCDVGCGTGLLGPLLRPLARRLDGIDCSPRMLDEARARGTYDDLTEADLTSALASRPGAYHVVTAADVFVYIGDLAPALTAVTTALRPGGLVAFTVERSHEEGYRLTTSGRYEHGPAFVRQVADGAGLTMVSEEEVTLRRELSRPVAGLVWVARKGDAAAT